MNMSETVLCSLCKIPLKNGGIEVFLQQKMTWKYDEEQSIEKPYQSKVCKKCLVGWNIPVQRCMNNNKDQQKEQVWEFGIVESYKEESNLHSVRFINDSSEWIKVEMNTFEQYIAYCTNMITLLNQKKDIATATAAAAATATANDSGNQEISTKESEIYTPFDMECDHGLHSPAGLLASPAGTPLKSELQVLPALRGGNTVANNQSSPRLLEIPYLSYHHASPYSPAKKRQRITKHPSDVGCGRVDDHMVETKIAASHISPPLEQNGRDNKMMYSTWASTSTSTPTRDKGGNESTKTTNYTPKQRQRQLQSTWSPAEDNVLLQSVTATKDTHQFGWPQIAKTIPGRTGKQCRERYLNHLKPSLKLAKYWSPMEDAAIFSLFAKHGSKWSMMSKFITGRSDNNIKNRYNHLKRKFEKQIESILLRCNNNNTRSPLPLLPPLSVQLQSLVNELKQQKNRLLPSLSKHGEFGNALLKYAAFEIIQKSSPSYNRSIRNNNQTKLQALASPLSPSSSLFSPTWRLAMFPGETCARCCLTVPSVQCGRLICNKLGWCENCYDILPCVSGDLLRKIHSSYAAGASQA